MMRSDYPGSIWNWGKDEGCLPPPPDWKPTDPLDPPPPIVHEADEPGPEQDPQVIPEPPPLEDPQIPPPGGVPIRDVTSWWRKPAQADTRDIGNAGGKYWAMFPNTHYYYDKIGYCSVSEEGSYSEFDVEMPSYRDMISIYNVAPWPVGWSPVPWGGAMQYYRYHGAEHGDVWYIQGEQANDEFGMGIWPDNQWLVCFHFITWRFVASLWYRKGPYLRVGDGAGGAAVAGGLAPAILLAALAGGAAAMLASAQGAASAGRLKRAKRRKINGI